MGMFAVVKMFGDHAVHFTATSNDAVGNGIHNTYRAAAINQPDILCSQLLSEELRLLDKGRIITGTGAAKYANALNVFHPYAVVALSMRLTTSSSLSIR